MRLTLLRHGLAEVGVADAARSLTPQGHTEVERVASALARANIWFQLVLTSPLLRARQTAEILIASGLARDTEESDLLSPNADHQALLNWLARWRRTSGQPVALVGHHPTLGQLAELLTLGEIRGRLRLVEAGFVSLELPENGDATGRSVLTWLASPRLLS